MPIVASSSTLRLDVRSLLLALLLASISSAAAGELNFTLRDLDDRPIRLADFRGQWVIVNFWASWCAPCRVEHPHLMALAAEGVPVYGVNYKDEPAKALAFLAEMGNPYRAVGADLSGRMGIDWGLYGVPETFVIDGKGVIRYQHIGDIRPENVATLLDQLEKAR